MPWTPITDAAPQHRQKVRCKINHHKGEYVFPGHYYYNANTQLFMLPAKEDDLGMGHISVDAWIDAEEVA